MLQPTTALVCAGKEIGGLEGTAGMKFEDLFADCVEQGLTDLLGVGVREALLDYLARHDRIAREDIARHPREFSEMLETALGEASVRIERYIIRKLCATLNRKFDVTEHFDFGFQIHEARRFCENAPTYHQVTLEA